MGIRALFSLGFASNSGLNLTLIGVMILSGCDAKLIIPGDDSANGPVACEAGSTHTSTTTLTLGSTSNPAGLSQILSTFEAWDSTGTKMTGSMANRGAFDARATFPGAGYYNGTVSNAPLAGDICGDSTILGVAGAFPCLRQYTTTGSLVAARGYQKAIPLPNGKIAMIGGVTGSNVAVIATDLYDIETGTFSASTDMHPPRYPTFAVTYIPSVGKILVSGGSDTGASTLNSASLYDPLTGVWTQTPDMTNAFARQYHESTLLADGRVLVSGGQLFGHPDWVYNNATIYNPTTNTWANATGAMVNKRQNHSAILLHNRRVLLVGGDDSDVSTATAEVFDPVAGTFSATSNSMLEARYSAHIVTLPNGKVLVASDTTAEIYDPATNSFTATGTFSAGLNNKNTAQAVLLSNGNVLFVMFASKKSAVYNTKLGTFSEVVANLPMPAGLGWVGGFSATALPTGQVLIVGGSDFSASTTQARLFY